MKTILIVDDSASMRQLVAVTLEKQGYRVVEACDGSDALAKLTMESVQLILTDLNMPVMDGVELIQRARTLPQCRRIPIFVLTDSRLDARTAGKAAGATGWITKPFTCAQLKAAVENVLSGCEPRQTVRPDPLTLFHLEAGELLTRIEKAVLELGRRPDDLEAIDRLFRAFHTLKGTGSMFGFDQVAGLSRQLETMLREARDRTHAVDEPLLALVRSARERLCGMLRDSATASPGQKCQGHC